MIKKCVICGKIFNTTSIAKGCSIECRKQLGIIRDHNKYVLNRRIKTRKCIMCNKIFEIKQYGGGVKCCSEVCKKLYRKQKYEKNKSRINKIRRINKDLIKCCPICKKTFKMENGNDVHRKYCSINCKVAGIRLKYKNRQIKRRQDIKYRIGSRMSLMIYYALRGKIKKSGRHWETVVGYNIKQLMSRLQSTMPIDATWDDVFAGKLHVDHIRPVSSFCFFSSQDEQFKQCWALDNLQLLWAKDNLSKGSKLEACA